MATKEQMKTEFAYFGDAWNFFKKYYEVRQDDDYWDAVVADAGEIVQRYNNLPLCKDLVLAILDELDRKGKAAREWAV